MGKGGAGLGLSPDGRVVQVRPAPVGSRIAVVPQGRKRGGLVARRLHMVRPPASFATPQCAVFGLCGGCALQEQALVSQRRVKHEAALRDVAEGMGIDVPTLRSRVHVHDVEGAPSGYGYRNKVELSFATKRYLSEEAHREGEPITGRWLGFHAPGRFDRVVDAERCELVDEAANALIATLRRSVLDGDDQPLWDPRTHEGVWRHALLRRGQATGEHLVGLYTTSAVVEERVEIVARALLETPLPAGQQIVGVVWLINDGVADVARGDVRRVWGSATLTEYLRGVAFQLSVHSFFQTNTAGAEVLVDCVARALGRPNGTLLDLYCGIGALGLALANGFDRIVGVEEVEQAVVDARTNAERAGVSGTWRAGRVEDLLTEIEPELAGASVIVDPPRVGLHPRVARRLADLDAAVLVYVACKPGSLGRDAQVLEAGGWRMVELWTVDLFPQTGHVEMVGRFERVAGDLAAAVTPAS